MAIPQAKKHHPVILPPSPKPYHLLRNLKTIGSVIYHIAMKWIKLNTKKYPNNQSKVKPENRTYPSNEPLYVCKELWDRLFFINEKMLIQRSLMILSMGRRILLLGCIRRRRCLRYLISGRRCKLLGFLMII